MTIIHIIGLPGAGKTTLAKKLSFDFKSSIFHIGEYRTKFPMTVEGEIEAWISLIKDILKYIKTNNCILETTGLNYREELLRAKIPAKFIITLKLLACKKILYERIRMKRKMEQGNKWTFSSFYPDKFMFVDKLYRRFEKVPADILIDTNSIEYEEVYNIALQELSRFDFHS